MAGVGNAGRSGDGGDNGERAGPSKSATGTKVKRDYMKGKPKKKYSVAEKKKIIEMIEEGFKTCEIVKRLNVPESSVRNIRKKKEEIKKTLKVADRYFSGGGGGAARAVQDTKTKTQVLVIMEHFLMKWFTRRLQEDVSVDGIEIRDEARTIYSAVCKKKGIRNPAPFDASKGWLYRFRKRCGVKYSLYQGEIASADVTAARNYPEVAKLIIEEGGYSLDQIFNCDETAVYWKRNARATYIPTGMKQAPGLKMSKDRFSVLLTCNASGDFKMKPVIIYKYAKPHSYRNCDMSRLENCVWYSNAKGYVTAILSVQWFDKVFVPQVEAYCLRKNIAFKAVLFLDNAPGHAEHLVGRHANVQVVFLPPNTTSKLQPLDQEIIANTKLIFYGMLHNKLRRETDSQEELKAIEELTSSEEDDDPEPAELASPPAAPQPSQTPMPSIRQFWKGFKIKHAVDMFCVAWSKITTPTIKHGWSKLLPHLNLEQENQQRQEQLVRETTEGIRQLPDMSHIDEASVQALIDQRGNQQTIEEMLDADEVQEEEVRDESNTTVEPSTKLLSHLLANLAEMNEIVTGLKLDKQSDALQLLDQLSKIFKEVYDKKIQASQQSLITRYMRRQTEGQQAVRDAIEDIDLDIPVDVVPSSPPDADFEGFEEAVEEALRIERQFVAQGGIGVTEEENESGDGVTHEEGEGGEASNQ